MRVELGGGALHRGTGHGQELLRAVEDRGEAARPSRRVERNPEDGACSLPRRARDGQGEADRAPYEEDRCPRGCRASYLTGAVPYRGPGRGSAWRDVAGPAS